MALLELLDASEIFVQIINFLLVFFLLKIFLWRRFLGFLDRRQEHMTQEFNKIQQAQTEVSQLKTEYQQKINQIEEAARSRIQNAVLEAQRISQEIKDQANRDAEKIIASAKEELQFELRKAKEALKVTVVDLTIQATQQLIQEKLTPEMDKKLVENFLTQIDQTP